MTSNTSNIIVHHGFQEIYLKFSVPNNKGQKLYESQHVINVQENKPIGYSRITGHVIRQTSVTLEPWKVTLDVCLQNHLL
jgi:hypothetical protein